MTTITRLNGDLGHVDHPDSERTAGSPGRGGEPSLRQRLLGRLLVREGLISELQMEAALGAMAAEGRDGRPLGHALVEQGLVSPAQLAGILDQYHRRYRLGDLLLEAEVITESQLEIALDQHRRTGLRLGDALLQLGFVGEEELKRALCAQLGLDFVDLDRLSVDGELATLVPRAYAQHHRVVPIARAGETLTVAVADPTDGWLADDLQVATGCRIQLVASTDAGFQRAFGRVYGEPAAASPPPPAASASPADQALARGYEAVVQALADLRGVQELATREHAAALDETARERMEREAAARALAETRLAHETLQDRYAVLDHAHGELRAEHEAVRQALAETARREAESTRALETLRADHDWLVEEHESTDRRLAEERARTEEWSRAFGQLEASHEAARQEADHHVRALERLREEYSLVSRTLTELRADHEMLRGEHERATRELHERCQEAQHRQVDAVQQLEAVLQRLRA